MGIKLVAELLLKNVALFLSDSYFRQFIVFALKLGSKSRYKPQTILLNGKQLQIADSLSFIWQYKEIFADQSYFFKSQNQSPFILDCGTNIGLSILYFKHIYPTAKVVGFEPDPSIFAIAQANIKQHILNDVEIRNEAVWVADETLHFDSEGADGGSISSKNSKASIQVKAIKLKTYLAAVEKVEMLKMDIEGAEIAVLLDCKEELSKVDNIFIEYHSTIGQPQQLGELIEMLQRLGMRYTLNTPNFKNKPISLIGRNIGNGFDLQVNVFATKNPIS